jgi:hypothetical protein
MKNYPHKYHSEISEKLWQRKYFQRQISLKVAIIRPTTDFLKISNGSKNIVEYYLQSGEKPPQIYSLISPKHFLRLKSKLRFIR